MDRRHFVRLGLVGCAGAVGGSRLLMADEGERYRPSPLPVSTRAIDVVMEATVIDMLGLLTLDWIKLFGWQADPARFSELDFRRLESARINVYHPAVETAASDPRAAALRWVRGWTHLARSWPCFLGIVETAQQLASCDGAPIGIILGFQNSSHFIRASDVAEFHGLGQRVSQLTYNDANRLGGGCLSRSDRGLTSFGAEVVAEMSRLGMAIDVSHCGDRTTLDAVAASTKPVLVTHSNCRAIVPGQPRCKTDEAIRALARKGGVMGLTAIPAFVSGSGGASLDDVLDHFDHVIRLVGIEHVGIGSDVSSDAGEAQHLAVRRRYHIAGLEPGLLAFQVADGLLHRGYARRDVALVLGGNFQRVLGEIWTTRERSASDSRAARPDPFCPAPTPPPVADSARLASPGAPVDGRSSPADGS